MPGHLQEDQLKKIEDVQKQKLLHFQQQEPIHKAIHKNLTDLQTWDLAQGQTLEERREAHKEALIHDQLQENAAMQAAAQAQVTRANAAAAAPGTPVQEQAPAKQSYKQRKEQARKAKKAKKRCPVGTADTYDCAEGISRVLQERKNALAAVPEDTDVDMRVLGTFCQGYKVNKKGKPATPEDQAKADSDNAFLDAYISKDVEKRQPYLEAFCKEMMDFPLSADTISDAYMVKNVGKLKRITDRAYYLVNVMEDPINKPYFDSLDPTDLDLLKEKRKAVAQLGRYFNAHMGEIGVRSNKGEYYGHEMADTITDYAELAKENRDATAAATAGWKQKKREILERHMENEAAQEREQKLREISKEQAEQTTYRWAYMNFSSPAVGYANDDLKRYRAMIDDNPDAYVANQPLIDQLYQELYRNMDILNDFVFDSMVYQSVYDKKNESPKSTDKALAKLAFEKVERCMNSIDTVRKKSDPIGQALEFYLKGKPLTDGARALLEKMGQNG